MMVLKGVDIWRFTVFGGEIVQNLFTTMKLITSVKSEPPGKYILFFSLSFTKLVNECARVDKIPVSPTLFVFFPLPPFSSSS